MSGEDLSLIFPYTYTQLTERVDRIPNLYGLVNELNLFPVQGSVSRIVELTYENHTLRVLPAKERGAPATPQLPRTAQSIFIEIPHFPELDLITPQDIQDILIVTDDVKRLTTVDEEVSKRLVDIKANHDVTLEWLRCGALQGTIVDGNSQTLINLYTALGVNQTTVDFALGTSGTDIQSKCAAVWQAVTTNLQGEVMNGIECIVDPVFFEALITHPNVQAFYVNAEQALMLAQLVRKESAGNMWGRQFKFGNILFREYYGTAPIKSSPTATTLTNTSFWSSKTGSAFPTGTRKMFRTYYAPAHDLRFVNQRGQQIYISPKIKDHGEGIELKSESNPLPICRRPEAVVKVFSSN
jgi:hypothetical protein